MAKRIELNTDFEATTSLSDLQKVRERIIRTATTLKDDIHFASLVALREWYKNDNPNWIGFIIKDLHPLGGSIRVQAVISWFEIFGGVTVQVKPDGAVSVSKNKKWKGERDVSHYSEARNNPYHKIAPPEAPIKMPEMSYKAVAAMLARREFLGEEPDWSKVMEDLKAEFKAAHSTKGFAEWTEKAKVAIDEGELDYIVPPVGQVAQETPVTEAA